MAVPQNTDTIASYIVYRDIPAGEPFDPTSPLLFFPPKGSDELFDALRMAFPHLKTHSERMRDAIIQYLLEERHEEQSYQQNHSPATTMDTMQTNWPSVSSDTTSLLSSPELLNFGTPATSFANSPQSQGAQLIRQASTSGEASPPTLDAMTGVFSVSTSEQPKQRMRRKMTEAEKVEYRKRRIVKACDKCAKRKRKCPHNQAQMESVPTATSKTTARVSKSTSPKSGKSATPPLAHQDALIDPSLMSMDDLAFLNNLDPISMAPIEDFNMFDDSFPELDMTQWNFADLSTSDNSFTPDMSPTSLEWLQDPITHFKVQDSETADHEHANGRRRTPSHRTQEGIDPDRRLPFTVNVPQLTHAGTSLDSSASSDAQSSWEGYDLEGGFMADGGQYHVGGGDGMLWQHQRTGPIEKPVPTHTAHVHDATCGGLNSASIPANSRAQCLMPPTTLPEAVLRLTGTKKALKSLAGLLGSRSLTLASNASLEDIFDAQSSQGTNLHVNENATGHGSSRNNAGIIFSKGHRLSNAASLDNPANTQRTVLNGSELALDAQSLENVKTIEVRKGATGLSRRARRSGTALSSLEQPLSHSRTNAASLLLQRSETTQNGHARMPQYQRRPEPTLGEGLSAWADASVQLYMTRRRTNLTANTLCGANMNAGLPAAGTTGGAQLSTRSNHNQSGGVARFSKVYNVHQMATSANGGAYPRLEEPNALLSRARQPTFSDFAGITSALHKQDDILDGDIRTVPDLLVESATISPIVSVPTDGSMQERPSYHMLLCDHHGRGSRSSSSSTTTEAPLLSHGQNTNRFRDHHGRQQQANVLSLARSSLSALCFFLLVSVAWLVSAGSGVASSLLLLAVLHIHEPSLVESSTKKPGWLSTFASRQVGSLAGVWQGKCHGRDGNWYQGLMHPHQLSPLRNALA